MNKPASPAKQPSVNTLVSIDRQLHSAFRKACFHTETDMKDVINTKIYLWLHEIKEDLPENLREEIEALPATLNEERREI